MLKTLTPSQHVQIGLPEYAGGNVIVSAKEVLDQAFVAGAGDIACWCHHQLWSEARVLLDELINNISAQVTVSILNDPHADNKCHVSVA